jgi:hypothetical protein
MLKLWENSGNHRMTTNSAIEELEFGITRQYLKNKQQIFIKTQGDMRREAIDRWSEVVVESLTNWGNQPPILLLMDLSAPTQGITPYALKRLPELNREVARLNIPIKAAIVFRNMIITRMFRAMSSSQRNQPRNLQVAIFTDITSGQVWLDRFLAEG